MKPLAIIIMDGFGISPIVESNAVAKAHKPKLERFWKNYPTITLAASGLAVGLSRGQMGNSEVGHLSIGGGRIVYQDYTRISQAVEQGTVADNEVLLRTMEKAKDARMHLIGPLSDGGVHSHITYLYALFEMARKRGLESVYVHAVLDGRDVPSRSALIYLQELEEKFQQIGTGKLSGPTTPWTEANAGRKWRRPAAHITSDPSGSNTLATVVFFNIGPSLSLCSTRRTG
jgi:2,3-bisphosphoglycerate-independent phosphoglycerate mutase